jgi:hypothetical protein
VSADHTGASWHDVCWCFCIKDEKDLETYKHFLLKDSIFVNSILERALSARGLDAASTALQNAGALSELTNISENEAVRPSLKSDAIVSALEQVSNVAAAAPYVGAAFALLALAVHTYENMQYNMTNLLDSLVRWHRIGFRLGDQVTPILGQELRGFTEAYFVLSQQERLRASYMVDRRLRQLHELLLAAVSDRVLEEVQRILQVLKLQFEGGKVQLQPQWKHPDQIPDHILCGLIPCPEELKKLDECLRPSEGSPSGASAALQGMSGIGREDDYGGALCQRLWYPLPWRHPLGRCWKAVQHRRRYNTCSTKNTDVGLYGRCQMALE